MKRKILYILLFITLLLGVTGCTSEKGNKKDSANETLTDEELKLYSDNTKYVFELANTKYVFYYKDDTITAYHTYVNYEDNATAKNIYNTLKIEEYPEAEKFYVKGKYIVFEWKETEYADLKPNELKTVYSYMKEVKK